MRVLTSPAHTHRTGASAAQPCRNGVWLGGTSAWQPCWWANRKSRASQV